MAEVKKEKTNLDDRMLMLFEGNLKRIFAMKVTRSTFREIQNIILTCANGDRQLANDLFEMLMTGQIKESFGNEKQREILESIIRDFTIPSRLAKEVFERGEFINIITSDTMNQQEKYAFFNRLRRIDGEEFQFITDLESTLHLLQHFVGRLQELEKAPKGKETISKYKKEIHEINDRLKQVAS